MGGVCTTSCRPQIPKDENSPVKTSGHYLKRKKIFSGGFNLANGISNEHLNGYNCDKLENNFDSKLATININQASEEDLMIVPGVNRELAHRIVDYRKQLGAFRREEDLAPCVGAVKFEKLRKEFHVSPLQKVATSTKSLASTSSDYTPISSLLSINTATIAQLSRVPHLGEGFARKIVHYRQKHSYFQHCNDLVDPANILDVHTFLKVKGYLSVSLKTKRHSRHISSASRSSHMFTSVGNGMGLSEFGPDCIPSHRPLVKTSDHLIDGRLTVRVCSWNLQECNIEKITNPGVREVFCMTLLENGVRILAVQGCFEHQVLQEITNELNSSTLPNVQRHKQNSRSWKCSSIFSPALTSSPHGVGFIWDTSNDLENITPLNNCSQLPSVPTNLILSTFKVKDTKVHLVALYWNPSLILDRNDNKDGLQSLSEEITGIFDKYFDGNDKVGVLTTTNAVSSTNFVAHKSGSFSPLLKEDTFTDIRSSNLKGSKLLDNIYVNQALLQLYTGRHGVIRTGLSNPWIPDGWKWGGLASDHCPIIADFFVAS